MNIGWKKDNIGYLEFRAFCSPDVAGEKVRSVMNFLSDMDALIIDLRSLVMGGKPEMVSLISGYFFEEPTLLNRTYFRKENITDENWSYQVEGIRFPPDIPLYILVNGNVFSAGEAFTYSLQALDRAIVIGERTGGGAHLTKSFRINNRFEAKIPWGRTINPVTGTNWEGTGVIPDFEVKSDTALEIAMEMASVEALKRREIREAKDEALVLKLLEQYKELKELYQKGYAEQATKTLDNLLNDGIYFGLLSEEMIDDFGYYLMENELLDLAFQCFQYNIDHFPESFTLAGYYYSLAEAYLEKEDSNQAIVCLKKSLEINPNDKWAEQLLKSIEQ